MALMKMWSTMALSQSHPGSSGGSPPGRRGGTAARGRRDGCDAARDNLLELLRPGSFVCLKDHPEDLPPFQLIHCHGGRCWVRQQAWGRGVHWEVAHGRLTEARPERAVCSRPID